MELTINLPDSYIQFYDKDDITKELQINNALMLYRQERVSISKAAELSGLDIYEFIVECKKNKIPVIDYNNKEELQKEIEN